MKIWWSCFNNRRILKLLWFILPWVCNFIKKETLPHVFSCQFCKISKKTFFYRTPPDDCFWSSPLEVFSRKGVLKMRSKFTGEYRCRSAISIKLFCNCIEIALRHERSPVNLLPVFGTFFPKNFFGGLLLIDRQPSKANLYISSFPTSHYKRCFVRCFYLTDWEKFFKRHQLDRKMEHRGLCFNIRCGSRKCDIYLTDKYLIARANQKNLLNKRTELISKCRHKNKFILKIIKSQLNRLKNYAIKSFICKNGILSEILWSHIVSLMNV